MNQIFLFIAIFVTLLIFISSIVPVSLWFQAVALGIKITILQILIMKWRGEPVDKIIKCLISTKSAGILITRKELEIHYLSGGNVSNVTDGMIEAKKAGLTLTFEKACEADLKGANLVETIKNGIKKNNL